jgi:hypothetical protein
MTRLSETLVEQASKLLPAPVTMKVPQGSSSTPARKSRADGIPRIQVRVVEKLFRTE